MQYFTEQADTQREAMERIRAKYGEGARILSHRTVRRGGFFGLWAREAVEVTGYLLQSASANKSSAPATRDFEEEKKRILAQAQAQSREQAKIEQPIQELLSEIRGLKEKIDEMPTVMSAQAEDHESLRKIDELLALNEFTDVFRAQVMAKMRRDFTLESLEDFDEVEARVIEWIGDSIALWKEPEAASPRVLCLVGPTGVGKTTTIAKLAAIYKIGMAGERPRNIRMITIDNYRIGARQQLETYGRIMEVPVFCVETADDLKKTIALNADADIILVDTVGKSPRDAVRLAEMQRVLAAAGPKADILLALPATLKASDIAQALRQFEPFDYKALVLTKLDETDRIGNALSVLTEKRKAIAYVTNGQKVPQDIERARIGRLLMNLEGFRIDRAALEARYGEADPEIETTKKNAGPRRAERS